MSDIKGLDGTVNPVRGRGTFEGQDAMTLVDAPTSRHGLSPTARGMGSLHATHSGVQGPRGVGTAASGAW